MKFGVALSIVVLLFCGSSVHAASAPQAIRVAYTSVTGNRAPFWIAKEAKLFEKHGLQVELIYLQSVAVGMPALLGGDFQILAGGVAGYLSAASRGAKLLLFGTFGPTPYILFTRPEIQTVAQLKGSIIGVNRIGASDYYAVRRILQRLDLSPDRDVKIISAGSPLDRLISVEKGAIHGTLGTDMGLATNPVKVRRLVDLTQMGVEDHGSALVTTVNFARTQPDVHGPIRPRVRRGDRAGKKRQTPGEKRLCQISPPHRRQPARTQLQSLSTGLDSENTDFPAGRAEKCHRRFGRGKS